MSETTSTPTKFESVIRKIETDYKSGYALRHGIPLEKGVAISNEALDNNFTIITKWLNHWMLYPDLSKRQPSRLG